MDEEDLGGEDQEAGDHLQHEVDREHKVGHFQSVVGFLTHREVDDHDDQVDDDEEEGGEAEEDALDDPPASPSHVLNVATRQGRSAWVLFHI